MNKKGISLIVLSITILVMAILAATAIIALEDSGIIGRAKSTTKNTNYADEYTRLTVIKNGILTDNLGTITIDEFVTELTNKGLVQSKVVNADGTVKITTTSGFEVIISQNGTSELGIVIDGYTPPSVNVGGNNSGNNNTGNNNNAGNGNTSQYKLSGAWVFNDKLTQTEIGWLEQNINYFTQYKDGRNMLPLEYTRILIPNYEDLYYAEEHWTTEEIVYSGADEVWLETSFRIIDFGSSEQYVSAEFYNWFMANATQVISFTIQYDVDDYYNFDGYDYVITCYAKDGMTWAEWASSIYNYSDFYVDGSKHLEDNDCYEICLNKSSSSFVKSTETVISGHTYWLYWD